jgi:hypothetical protein
MKDLAATFLEANTQRRQKQDTKRAWSSRLHLQWIVTIGAGY